MVKEISRNISVPHQLQLLSLPDLDLRHCRACYRCLFKEQRCYIRDDLQFVLEAIAKADGLILAVPTYFLGAHSSLKLLLDRGLAFYGMAERLWGKPAIGVGVAGIEGKEGSTLLDIERFFKVLFAENRGSAIAYGALPGEALQDGRSRRIAAELANALFSPRSDTLKEPSCPLCGGQTFRFLAGDQVRCMVCSATGAMKVKDGQLFLEIARSDHELLASPDEALKHRDWLCGMVARFKSKKTELKELTAGYADAGIWISPEKDKSQGQ